MASEVLSLYQTDEARRAVTETVLPLVQSAIRRRGKGPLQAAEEAELDEWEDFDDWGTLFVLIEFV
jgi:hypothetical protein